MSPRLQIVLADDLTGAAEIAAIAHQAGLRAVVHTSPPSASVDADVLVLNLDTRLLAPAVAARRIQRWIAQLAYIGPARFYFKVDSVLRGPVLAQIEGALRALGFSRAFLVPANPSLGRLIRGGRYFVGGVPLHETAFARDPHHPRTTSEAVALLGRVSGITPVFLTVKDAVPAGVRVVLGEAGNLAHVLHWARQLGEDCLPVGGADFFRAWLEGGARKTMRRTAPRLAGPELLLHGTTAAPAAVISRFFRGRRAPSLAKITEDFSRRGFAIVAAPARRLSDPVAPTTISREIAKIGAILEKRGAFRHVLIVGGATAAAVLPALGWRALEVVFVWGPGVVTLRPAGHPEFAVTLKPGSYEWPVKLRRSLPRELLT